MYSGTLDAMRPLQIIRARGFYEFYPVYETSEGQIGQSAPEKKLLWGNEECEPLDPDSFIMRELPRGLLITPK